MWYVPWLHWTVARWVVGEPATHDGCNRVLACNCALADLHPANVVATESSLIVLDFKLRAVDPFGND